MSIRSKKFFSLVLTFVMLFSAVPQIGIISLNAASGSNVALRRAAYHSSAANYNDTGHLVTDGIIDSETFNSIWSSKGNDTESVYIDLGPDTSVYAVKVYWGDNYATAYDIQISSNAASWRTIASVSGADGGVIETSFEERTAAYLRILCKASSGSNYVIKEIEAFGSRSDTYSVGPMPDPLPDGTQYLTGGNWKVQRASEIGADGIALSKSYDDNSWLPASVPGTVLASYMKAGAVADHNYDDNQLQISDSFFTADFWYRNSFTIPASQQGKKTFLNFDAINWKADVYFNGHNVGRIEGAFIRGKFDVTEYVNYGGTNYLAVYIYKNDTPGPITLQSLNGAGPNGGPLGADNPTIHAAAGWDWVSTIRGRDIGIYNDVYLTYSKGLELVDPWMTTDLTLNEQPNTSYPNLANEKTATATSGDASKAIDGDTESYWEGADQDGESFIVDLGSSATFRTITVMWPNGSPWNSNHAEIFSLHSSVDGENWTAFGAANQTGTSGGSNIVQASANVTARYVRFTSVKRGSNGYFGVVPTRVSEILIQTATTAQLAAAMRTYKPDFSKSDVLFRTGVSNSTDAPVTAVVSGTIIPGDIPFSKEVALGANETKEVAIDGIVIENPKLWWPNTYGEQFLYTANVKVSIGDTVSDETDFKFGVRKFTYPLDNNLLAIYCNGTRIIARGGNWGMDDGLLLNTPESYDIKVRLHAEENFTMIRNWVGMTNNKAFYDACDKYGLLIWDDFWLANPSDGPSPTDTDMFMENAVDKVMKNRYHASLALYVGRNESSPPAPLLALLPAMVPQYDDTRYYIPNSAGAPVGSGGGYSLRDPRTYFGTVTNGRTLRSEYGIPNVPTVESIQRMMTTEHQWPINDVWGIHDFCLANAMNLNSYLTALKKYVNYNGTGVNALAQEYTLNDFSRVSQMINYENHKGLFEGLYVGRSNGLLMWMSQSAWPSFVWQTYDYYYDTNAGYFGIKAGNQAVHAVWDARAANDNIILSNATPNDLEDVKTVARLYDLNGGLLWEKTYTTDLLGSDKVIVLEKMAYPAGSTPVKFLKTFVYDKDGELLGENFYWMNSAVYQDYTALDTLKKVDLNASYEEAGIEDGNRFYSITLKNESGIPALMAHIKAVSAETGRQVLPVFYGDNYISLMPGESKTISVEFNEKYLDGENVRFELDGWNIVEKTIGDGTSDYIIKNLTFVQSEGGVNVWNVNSGDFYAKLTFDANEDTTVSLTPVIAVYKNGNLFDIGAANINMDVTAGQKYTVYSEPVTIPNEGELADLSMFEIKAFVWDADLLPLRDPLCMGDWIPTWEPLHSLPEKDRTIVNDFESYNDDAALGSQFAMGGSINRAQLIDSPFGDNMGKAMKMIYNIPSTEGGNGLGQYTGRHGTIAAEYPNADTLSFWIQTNGVFKQTKADTGEYLLFQFNSRGQSYELQFAFLAELGIFDPRSTEPQYIEVPVSLITPKDSAGYPGAPNYSSALFEIGTVGNFGVFLNTSGAVKSPQNAYIIVDDVRFTRKAPILDSIKRQHAETGETLTILPAAKVMDFDGYYKTSGDIVFSLIDPPAGASIDPDTGEITFSADVSGTYVLAIKAAIDGAETLIYGESSSITNTGPHPYVVDNTFTAIVPVTVN